MAEIIPFRALRYDASHLPIEKLVTQPYDKITPAMQQRYYQASPFNLVRIILGRAEPQDTAKEDIYRRSAAFFQDWRRDKILVPDPQPSIYVYAQRFSAPGGEKSGGEMLDRVGFIALGKIYDYSDAVVFRHEQTLSQPKADRLALLRATRAHFGQIFMLYSDPGQELDALLRPTGAPDVALSDEYGVEHSLWRCSDPGRIDQVRRRTAEKRLLIADGHHRYETAMAYRDERRRAGPSPSSKASPNDYDYVMMTFINMDSPGLIILPTHRVLTGIPGFDESGFFRDLAPYFRVEAVPESSAPELLERLKRAGENGTALLAVTAGGARLLRAIPESNPTSAHSVSAAANEGDDLDVVKLHRLVLQGALKMSEESIRQQKNISYIRDAGEAIQAVRSGEAQVAFLMNPVRIGQLRRIAFAGNVMPQKSTDFYPKLLSGLTIYALQ
jgi:uncharacterized protein (DUF1015 family)